MGLSTKDAKKLAKASALSHSDDPKDQDRARARQTEVDYKDLVRQLKAKRKKKMKESFEIDKSAHKKVQKKAKLRNLAKGNTNPNEKAAAEKKAGGPKLYGEENSMKEMTYQEAIDAGWEMTGEGIWWPPQPETVSEKISFPMFKKKAAERKPEKAMDAGAKAKRKLARKAHAKYVSGSEDNVPDDIRDHKEYTE